MSYDPPTPPANLPTEIVNTPNESDPEQLRDVATYAEALAERKEREARLEESADQEEIEDRPDDLPDDVPAKATITIKEINDKIIIVRMGSEPRELKQMLGMAVIRRIWSHIRGRAAESEHQRSPFYLFADEFDNLALADDTIPSMISESRSYRLAMTLANQYPAQLPSNVVDAITTNCDTIMSFNPGDKKSARTYCTQLGLDPDDLTEEVNYHYWMRTTISENMEQSDAFRVYAYPPFPPVRDVEARDAAIQRSLKKAGRERRSDEQVYENLLFNEGGGRWETGIGRQIAVAQDREEKLHWARELQHAVPSPDNPGVSGSTTERSETTPLSAGGDGANTVGSTGRGASTPNDAEGVVERHLDTVLESVFAARLRAGRTAGEYIPTADAKDELVARLEDSTVDSLSELSNIYERVNSTYAETERKDGTPSIRLTPQGRGVVLQQDTGSAGSGGGDDHRWILGQCYVAFTQIGYVSWLPEQEGEEMPDGVAEAPIDVTHVDEDLSPTEKLEAMEERRDQLREEYPGVWNFAGADNVSIEAETSTIKYPFQTFTNLRKAREKGEMCVFAVKDGSANHDSFTYWGERAEKVIYETEGTRHGVEVVSNDITFRKSPGPDGNPRYYNDGGGDYRVGDDKIALRERRPEDDGGQGNMGTIWYKDTETGEIVAAAGTAEKVADGGEIARFEDEEAAQNGDKTAVPAYYEYDKSDEEYIVYNDGDKEFYPSKEELEANWVPFRGPFLPTERFDTGEEEDDLPSDEDFEIIIFPDGDNDEYDQPQLYHRGECTPLFDHLGVESIDDVDAGEIEGPGEVEDATVDEPVDDGETGDDEADNDGESEEDAKDAATSLSPENPGLSVRGYHEAPTPTRIAADDRLDLAPEEVAAVASGERELSTNEGEVLQLILREIAEGAPEFTFDQLPEEIVIPADGVGAFADDTEAGDTDDAGDGSDGSDAAGGEGENDESQATENDKSAATRAESGAHDDANSRGDGEDTQGKDELTSEEVDEEPPESGQSDTEGGDTGVYNTEPTAANLAGHPDVSMSEGLLTAAANGDATISREQEGDLLGALTDFAVGDEPPVGLDRSPVEEIETPDEADTDGQDKTAERGQEEPEEASRSEPTTEPDQTAPSSETEPDEDISGDIHDSWDRLIDAELSDSESDHIQSGGPSTGGESQEADQDQPNTREDSTEDETEQEQDSGDSETDLGELLDDTEREDSDN